MITFFEYFEQEKGINKTELSQVEKYLDAVFSKLGIDVEFSKHFFERLHDDRNGSPITKKELVDLFQKEYVKYGKPIAQLGPDKEAVLTDLSSNVNTPIALNWNRDSQKLEMVVKTVMRKKDFKPKEEKHFKVQ